MMEIDTLALVRALHVMGVVLWIGGVAMVTTVLLPATRKLKSAEEQVMFFEKIEQGFARQARFTTLLTGLTGFYMLAVMHAWERYGMAHYWWIHAMTAIWAIFTVMLFILEPLVLHKWFKQKATQNPGKNLSHHSTHTLDFAHFKPCHDIRRSQRRARLAHDVAVIQ